MTEEPTNPFKSDHQGHVQPAEPPVGIYIEQGSLHRKRISTSFVLALLNFSLLVFLVSVLGTSNAFQFLMGIQVAEETKRGLFYGVGVLILFFLRLGFMPTLGLLGLFGLSLTLSPLINAKGRTKFYAMGLAVFHAVCLVPPVLFVIRFLAFTKTH